MPEAERTPPEQQPTKRRSKKRWVIWGLVSVLAASVVVGMVAVPLLPGIVQGKIIEALSTNPAAQAECGQVQIGVTSGQVDIGKLRVALTEGGKQTELLGW